MSKFNLVDKKFYPWLAWGLAACFYGYRYLLEVYPAVMVNDLMRDLSINAAILGNLAAFFLYAYAGMQIPVGMLLDKFGARRLLTIAAVISSLGVLLFAMSSAFPLAAFGRLMSGLGASVTAVGCMYIASKWIPANRFALATGLVLTVGMVGAIGGSAPLALLVSNSSWRSALLILSIGGFLISALIWMFVRDKNENKEISAGVESNASKNSVFFGLKCVTCNAQSWLLSIYAGLLFMPISIFGSLWGVPFLINKYNCSNSYAATLIITLFMGLAAGSPVFGWLSDHIKKRKHVMYISSIGTTLSMSILLYAPNLPQSMASVMMFAFGFFTGACFVAYASIVESNCKDHSGSALGFMNMLNMAGGALGMPLVGIILDWQWNGAMLEGVRVYSLANYQVALSLLPLVMLLSLFTLPKIKETYSCEDK